MEQSLWGLILSRWALLLILIARRAASWLQLQRLSQFGGKELVSRGVYNIALAKLDADGQHIWSHSFGDYQYHVCECMAVANDGSVVLAGRFQGSVDSVSEP